MHGSGQSGRRIGEETQYNKVRAKGSQERRDRPNNVVFILLTPTLRSNTRNPLHSSVPLFTLCVHYSPQLNFQMKFIRMHLVIFERNSTLYLSAGLGLCLLCLLVGLAHYIFLCQQAWLNYVVPVSGSGLMYCVCL